MCRNIKTLFNFEPPATEEEVFASALQYVRKISGFQKPSKQNEAVMLASAKRITNETHRMLANLTTIALPKDRDEERRKAKIRAIKRFG